MKNSWLAFWKRQVFLAINEHYPSKTIEDYHRNYVYFGGKIPLGNFYKSKSGKKVNRKQLIKAK